MRDGSFERRRSAAPRTLRRLLWGTILAVASAPSTGAQTPAPTGAQFQVNTYTTGTQRSPFVAADAHGNFVVVWESGHIKGQRYDSAGSAVGSEFQVNTYTTFGGFYPWVAADADGEFVVVWESDGSPGSDIGFSSSVQGRRYDSAGSAIGSQFQVNTYTTSTQGRPSVAVDADGDFIVVWHSLGASGGDTSSFSIQGQRYNSAGSAVGSQFQVNFFTDFGQVFPVVAADTDGDFIVVWASPGVPFFDPSGTSVQGQRYNSAGSAVGSQFQVNTYSTGNQLSRSVAVEADGDFVVVWQSQGSSGGDSSDYSVQGQRYASAGSKVGSEFQINTYSTFAQRVPIVAAQADGDFVVVWHSQGSPGGDSSDYSIQGRRYDSAGSPVGIQFQVNTYTTYRQYVASVAADADGDFVVVWESYASSGGDTSGHSIQGQRFAGPIPVPALGYRGLALLAALLLLAPACIGLRRGLSRVRR